MSCVNSKKEYLNLMRALAIVFVVFNHTGSDGFFLFSRYEPYSIVFVLELVLSLFCKFAVPLFLVVSGSLMLAKNYTSKELCVKFIKFSVVLLLWSGMYYVAAQLLWNTDFSFKGFLKILYSSRHKYHLWYLYAYLAYLVSIPYLKAMCTELENKYFMFMALVGAGFGILPMLEYMFGGGATINQNFKPQWMLSMIVFYPVMGYFVEHRLNVKNVSWFKTICLWLLNISIIFLGAYATTTRCINLGSFVENKSQVFYEGASVISAPIIFLTVKKLFISFKGIDTRCFEPVKRTILLIGNWIGDNSFGIYLLHPLIKDLDLFKRIYIVILEAFHHRLLTIWIYIFLLIIVCGLITSLIKRIPGVGQVI